MLFGNYDMYGFKLHTSKHFVQYTRTKYNNTSFNSSPHLTADYISIN